MGLLAKFLGRTASEGAAFAMGTAVAPALRPIVQDIYNETWAQHPVRPVDAGALAEAVASGHITQAAGAAEAALSGYDGDAFGRLVSAAVEGPGVAPAFQMWRRGLLSQAGFEKAAKRAGLEDEWVGALVGLHDVLLSPSDLAMARQQGFVDVGRQHDESARQGVTNDRADILFEISGLPPGIGPATEALHRGFIGDGEFAQIVREGHTKTKYTDLLLRLAVPLLNPATIVNLYLRGWITEATYHGRMAQHGYSAADADDWFKSAGRPAAPVQMFTAWARGVDGPDGTPMDQQQFLKGIRESDIRPEWGPMLWGIRHAYPSLFQLRRAVQEGAITRQRALTILHYERYEDADAAALVASWISSGGTGAKGLTAAEVVAEFEGLYLTRAEAVAELEAMGFTPATAAGKLDAAAARRVRTTRNAAVAAIGKRFLAWRADEAEVRARLVDLGVPTEAQDHLLTLWGYEREDKIRLLTPAQVKKAVSSRLLTDAQALVELEHLGFTPADAQTFLRE